MVAGVPIDEQRAQREGQPTLNRPPPATKAEPSAEAGSSSLGGGDDSDDERDPNDIVIRNVASVPITQGAYSNLDESDYESQSDED